MPRHTEPTCLSRSSTWRAGVRSGRHATWRSAAAPSPGDRRHLVRVAYQRTAVNTECKYLLLRHAFEELGCIRVQFKTDLRNERSQRAIERIGAVKEGVLRNHMILPDGFIRHSVYYSIIEAEWPAVKARLVEKLDL